MVEELPVTAGRFYTRQVRRFHLSATSSMLIEPRPSAIMRSYEAAILTGVAAGLHDRVGGGLCCERKT